MRIRASVAMLLTVTGCSTTYKLPKAEISRLDGWFVPDLVVRRQGDGRPEAPGPVRLRDTEGREHLFTEDTPLLIVQNDGGVIAEKFIDVNVDAERFRGTPQDAFRRAIDVPLSDVKSAGIRELHMGKTLALVGGIALGLVGAIVGMKMAIGDPPRAPAQGDPCGDLGCQF
jgi:hypothetical protein